ncbi:hypothetical protein pb186bvf_021148 [Paramecium bursaria]
MIKKFIKKLSIKPIIHEKSRIKLIILVNQYDSKYQQSRSNSSNQLLLRLNILMRFACQIIIFSRVLQGHETSIVF